MQAGELNFSGVEHLLNPGHERDANAVAQFHAIEAEILDLAQHFIAGGMSSGVPAGGEGDHGAKLRHRRGLRLRAGFNGGGRFLASGTSGSTENQDGQRSVDKTANDQGDPQADEISEGWGKQTAYGR